MINKRNARFRDKDLPLKNGKRKGRFASTTENKTARVILGG